MGSSHHSDLRTLAGALQLSFSTLIESRRDHLVTAIDNPSFVHYLIPRLLPPFPHFDLESFGSPFSPSCPCRPMPLISTPPASLTPLPWVAGSLNPDDAASPVEMSLETRLEPTLTLRASAEFQSDAVGGSSGRGRLALTASMRPALL